MSDYHHIPQQALARDVLTLHVNGGITHWISVHGYIVNSLPEQVHAVGIDIAGRCGAKTPATDQAISKLPAQPDQPVGPGSGTDFRPAPRADASDHRRRRPLP